MKIAPYLITLTQLYANLIATIESFSHSITIKTFYDRDLETTNIFDEHYVNRLCNLFGEFYEEKNEKQSLPKCIRFKQTQTLYCHGEMENFLNYTKYEK